jgi:hypothetical protein
MTTAGMGHPRPSGKNDQRGLKPDVILRIRGPKGPLFHSRAFFHPSSSTGVLPLECCQGSGTCRTGGVGETIRAVGGEGLWLNIGSMGIRIGIGNRGVSRGVMRGTNSRGKRRWSARAVHRSGIMRWGRNRSICRAQGRCLGARSAGLCSRGLRATGGVRSVGLSCIPASSVRILIRGAGLSACSR